MGWCVDWKLIEKCADINGTESDNSLLYYACTTDNETIAKVLVDFGADMNVTISSYGRKYILTPLICDCQRLW